MLHGDLLGAPRDGTRRQADGTIAGQYPRSSGQKQQYFGRVDPFCAFAVLPMLLVAGFFFWSDLAILGVVLVALVVVILVFDSWANRPLKRSASRYRRDY